MCMIKKALSLVAGATIEEDWKTKASRSIHNADGFGAEKQQARRINAGPAALQGGRFDNKICMVPMGSDRKLNRAAELAGLLWNI